MIYYELVYKSFFKNFINYINSNQTNNLTRKFISNYLFNLDNNAIN